MGENNTNLECNYITLGYKKESGWHLSENLNTPRAKELFNHYFLHNRPIDSFGFQKICDSNYKFASMLDKEIGMKRQHKWILV